MKWSLGLLIFDYHTHMSEPRDSKAKLKYNL